MKKYIEIIKEIESTNSRIEKESLLKKYEKIPGLKEILKFVYDPMITSGLAKRKIEKEVCLPSYTQLDNIFDAIAYVMINNRVFLPVPSKRYISKYMINPHTTRMLQIRGVFPFLKWWGGKSSSLIINVIFKKYTF